MLNTLLKIDIAFFPMVCLHEIILEGKRQRESESVDGHHFQLLEEHSISRLLKVSEFHVWPEHIAARLVHLGCVYKPGGLGPSQCQLQIPGFAHYINNQLKGFLRQRFTILSKFFFT